MLKSLIASKALTNTRQTVLALALISFAPAFSLAQAASTPTPFGPGTEIPYDYFFTINEQPKPLFEAFQAPQNLMSSVFQNFTDAEFELLQWLKYQQPFPIPAEKYNRTQHFGRWVNDPTDTSCYNTRAKILIRDSHVPVTFKPNNHCVVDTGEWRDPYSGRTFRQSKDIQIDHFVPLKNAFQNGAWRWDSMTRCMYANFQSNEFHLLSVNAGENMSKGDRGPDRYIPSNDNYVCDYLENWLKIKLIWRLTLIPPEAEAIRELVLEHRCAIQEFVLDENQLGAQRRAIVEATQQCQRRAGAFAD